MYMNKNMLRGCAVLAILLVAYLLVIFLIPFAHTAVFWVSFVFTLVAFGVVAAACWLAFVRKPDAKSRFYGFPIARIGVIYGAAQLVCGLAFMALGKWVPVWAAVLVYALGLGAAAIGLIAADAVAEEIQAQDVRLKVNVAFMRDLQSKVNRMSSLSWPSCGSSARTSAIPTPSAPTRWPRSSATLPPRWTICRRRSWTGIGRPPARCAATPPPC